MNLFDKILSTFSQAFTAVTVQGRVAHCGSGKTKDGERDWKALEEQLRKGEREWRAGDGEWKVGDTDWKAGEKQWNVEEEQWKEEEREWKAVEGERRCREKALLQKVTTLFYCCTT